MKIAIEAGHAKTTPGKRTPDGENEWIFNNKVVKSAIEHLDQYENVEIIRLDDPTGKRDVPLKERTDKANKANADILVSVHHNANTGKWGNWTGTETYTYVGNWSKAEHLAREVNNRVKNAYKIVNRGLKKANFHMLRESKMPAILVECAFMDSKIDIKRMRDDSVLREAGKGIAEGIADYAGLKKKPKPKNDGKMYKVQIGAFSNKSNAERLAKQAKDKGFNTYIVEE